MIGNWLDKLHPVHADKVLTSPMKPGSWDNCLVSVIDPIFRGSELHIKADYKSYRCISRRLHTGIHKIFIFDQYDALCVRFTAPRINKAIRDRILHNKLRRTECQTKSSTLSQPLQQQSLSISQQETTIKSHETNLISVS